MEIDAQTLGQISQSLRSTAIYPPQATGQGFEVLDILLLHPDRSGKDIFEPTNVNLNNIPLSTDEGSKLQTLTRDATPDDAKLQLLCGKLTNLPEHVKERFDGMEVASTPTMWVETQKVERVYGQAMRTIENVLVEHFEHLLKETNLKAFAGEEMLLGVIVHALKGRWILSLDPSTAESTEFPSEPDYIYEMGNGTIGAQLLCFKAKVEEVSFSLSAPIPVVLPTAREIDASAKGEMWVGWIEKGILNIRQHSAEVFIGTHFDRSKTSQVPAEVPAAEQKEGHGRMFGGVSGSHLWNRNELEHPREDEPWAGFGKVVMVSEYNALNDEFVDQFLRWNSRGFVNDKLEIASPET